MFNHNRPHMKHFSLHALQTRMNAVWFNGKANDAQRECPSRFVAAYFEYNNVLNKFVPVSWLAYIRHDEGRDVTCDGHQGIRASGRTRIAVLRR